jgi:hypothetical protein
VVIEPTDEMIAAARDASVDLNGHCSTYLETKASIRAVFALVERDYDVRPRDDGNPYAGKPLAELDQIMQSDEYRRPSESAADRVAAYVAGPQCPRCTSPYRYHRFAITDGGGAASYCADPWHSDDAITSGTYPPATEEQS